MTGVGVRRGPQRLKASKSVDPKGLVFALFLLSGSVKADPLLAWLPVDLTLLCAGASVLLLWRERRCESDAGPCKPSRELWWMLGLFALFVPAVLWTSWTPYSVWKVSRLFTLTLLAGVAPFVLFRSDEDVYRLLHALWLVALAMALSSAFAYFTGRGSGSRIVASGVDTTALGRAAGMAMLWLLSQRLDGRGHWALFCVTGALLMMVLLGTAAKGPILAAAVSTGLVAWLRVREKPGEMIRIGALFVLLGLLFLVARGYVDDSALRRVGQLLQGRLTGSELERLSAYEQSWAFVKNHPLGLGWGGFARYVNLWEGLDRQYPHNVVLEVLLEGGWLAGAAFVILILLSLRRVYTMSHAFEARALLPLLLFFLLNALVSGDVNDNRMLFTFIALGLHTGRRRALPQESPARVQWQPEIVHLTSAHPACDVRIFHKECRALAAAGYKVAVVGKHQGDELRDGVQIRALKQSSGRFARFTSTVAEVYRLALQEDGQVYHFHDPDLIAVGMLLKMRGKRVVYDVHENLPQQILFKLWIPAPLRKCVSWGAAVMEHGAGRIFDAVVAATPTIGSRFPQVKTVLVQNFPVLEELPRSVQPYKRRAPIIAYPGGLSVDQGLLELVRAMELLPESLDARLVMAGEFDTPELRAQVEGMSGWRRVEFLGWQQRDEVMQLLATAQVGIVVDHPIPNYIDGYSTKMFEYMLAGLPVVASNFPLWQEIIGEAGCGLMVDPHQPEEVAEAIAWLLTHPDEAQKMGDRGRHAVLERFNWTIEAEKLLGLYSGLIGTSENPEVLT
ncbi:MAG: glycosyltransferase [Limnochordia bacterium]